MMDSIKHSPLPNMVTGQRHPDDHGGVVGGGGGPVPGQVVGGPPGGGGGPPQMNDLNSYSNFGDGVGLF
jgi:hypothetical protein